MCVGAICAVCAMCAVCCNESVWCLVGEFCVRVEIT